MEICAVHLSSRSVSSELGVHSSSFHYSTALQPYQPSTVSRTSAFPLRGFSSFVLTTRTRINREKHSLCKNRHHPPPSICLYGLSRREGLKIGTRSSHYRCVSGRGVKPILTTAKKHKLFIYKNAYIDNIFIDTTV